MAKDNFTSNTIVDPHTGVISRKYFYKRKPCNRLELTSKLAVQLAGYTLIDKDLRSCLAWLDEIDRRHNEGPKKERDGKFFHAKDRDNYVIIKGLFVAVLTFYAKCFVTCDGRRIKLEKVQLDKKYHALHDEVMSFRHNFAAHSGATKIERVKIAVAYSDVNPKSGNVATKVYTELDQPDIFSDEKDEVSFRGLVEYLRELVTAKRDQIGKKIEKEEVIEAVMAKIKTKASVKAR